MKIKEIQIGKISIPLRKPFKTALRTVNSAEDIVIKMIADSGEVGYGNAPPTLVITGDGQDSIVAAIKEAIAPKLIGLPVDALEEIKNLISGATVHNSSAKAAVDIAVHDLFAQQYKIPLYKLFGGYTNYMTTDLTISLNEPEQMVKDSLEAISEGYKALKLKVGNDVQLDLKRVQAIRKAVGNEVSIRLDANQGWTPKEAIRIIRNFEDQGLGIELIEQPVKAYDFEGLKKVTDNVDTDIMADESAFGCYEVFKLLSMRACDLINIKLMKAGGLHNANKIAAFAETMGVQCMMGCMLESKIGITAAASIAAGKSIITKTDLDAAVLLATDPIVGGVSFEQNKLILPDTPGLGITEVQGWTKIC